MANAPEERSDNRGVGFPQILHDRSREAGQELHKLLLSLSTASLAVYFFALTTKVDPPLTRAQQITVIAGMGAMALATLAGMIDIFADCRRNFFWASALQAEDKLKRAINYKHRDKWLAVERVSAWLLTWLFAFGIIASLVYVYFRVFAR